MNDEWCGNVTTSYAHVYIDGVKFACNSFKKFLCAFHNANGTNIAYDTAYE
jgi:hypothetical protein